MIELFPQQINNCPFCSRSLPSDALFCCYCGKNLAETEKARGGAKKRGNGQGTIYKRGNKYVAAKTVGYYTDETGKKHRKTVRKSFDKKKDAVEALPTLSEETAAPKHKPDKLSATFKDVYDKWLKTLTVGTSTQNCYKAAFKYFSDLYPLFAHEIDIDDLQECMDDCPRGRRTQENMKACVGLIYKYGIPRGYFPDKLNLAQYLSVGGDKGAGGKGLPDDYVTAIEKAVGEIPGADLIMAQCYLGFRPAEFLALTHESYDAKEKTFIGGAKTEAGKNRVVTVSPKIQKIVDDYAKKESEQFFCSPDGKPLSMEDYRTLFYSVLEALELDNPMIEVSGVKRHTYTPHSCRHVFASKMKRVAGADKDKQALIGHTSPEMLRYYQDAPISDLRKITDQF